jgi:hypothetical protein
MLPLLSLSVRAAPFLVEQISTPGATDQLGDAVSCPSGTDPIASGAVLFDNSYARPVYQLDQLRVTTQGTEAHWHRAPGTPSPPGFEVRTQALCADDDAAACIWTGSASTATDTSPEKSVDLPCPRGLFAIGGDFELTGDVDSVEVSASAPKGLLGTLGWGVQARVMDGTSPSWGLSGWVRCVPDHVYSEVVPVVQFGGGSFIMAGYLGNYDWETVYWDEVYRDVPLSSVALGYGARRWPTTPGGWVGAYTELYPEFTMVNVTFNGFFDPPNLPIGFVDPVVLVTMDPQTFEDLLGTCLPPGSHPDAVLDRFRVGADIWYGVAGGGGGVIFLPGSGPVPVDPEPFREAFAALPVGVATYTDSLELDARIREIGEGLTAERTPWSVVDDPAATLRGAGVVMVVPRDELAAVQWLSANRGTLGTLSHTTLVFLEEGGVGESQLAQW